MESFLKDVWELVRCKGQVPSHSNGLHRTAEEAVVGKIVGVEDGIVEADLFHLA